MLRLVPFMLLFFNFYVHAQSEAALEHAKKYNYNPAFRENHFDKMILKVDLEKEYEGFQTKIDDGSETQQNNDFTTNNRAKLRVSFDYDFLGIFLSTTSNFLQPLENKLENTKTLNLSFRFFYSDRMRQEIDYKTIRGVYLDKGNGATELFPEFSVFTYGGKTFYIINNDFSYRAFENQTERQLVSSGSFIPSIGYYFRNASLNRINEQTNNLTQIRTFDLVLQMGYMHNFVIDEKWFCTLGLHPGIGLNSSKKTFENEKNDLDLIYNPKANLNLNYKFNFSALYDNENYFSGIKFEYQNFEYANRNEIELINSRTQINFFVGYRFKSTKTVKKVFDKIKSVF